MTAEVEGASRRRDAAGVRFTLDPRNKAVKVDAPAILPSGASEATLYPGELYDLTAQAGPKYYVKRLVYEGPRCRTCPALQPPARPSASFSVVLANAAAIAVHITEGGNRPRTAFPWRC